MATWRGHGTEYLQNYLAKQQAEDKALVYLARLLTDKKCLELLIAFPSRYAHVDSSTDESRMLGHFVPTLIMLLLTKGRSAMLAKSEELDAIIESLAGDEGTLEHLGVQAENQDMVNGAESEIDTVKGNEEKTSDHNTPIINRNLDELKKIAQKKVPLSWGQGKANSKGVGWRWFGPNPKADGIRIDQGDPSSKYIEQQVDHVIIRSNCTVIGANGKPILGTIKKMLLFPMFQLSNGKTGQNGTNFKEIT